ncbi:hypothetical protein CARUB_v10007823mg [Capsella rubella]|uniref:Uncharacterized protein n=1 Tax=Capsella rubella TaxID=81985 RepID=R0F2G4_9BRAS|nr:hypothetical protein CARUB_v10007823mg [Capsella rubella]
MGLLFMVDDLLELNAPLLHPTLDELHGWLGDFFSRRFLLGLLELLSQLHITYKPQNMMEMIHRLTTSLVSPLVLPSSFISLGQL